jgi:hypothetical protein
MFTSHPSLCDEWGTRELGGWLFEEFAGFGWEFGEDYGVGGGEFAAPLGGGEDVVVEGGDPVGAGEVGCGDEAFLLDEFGEVVGVGGVGEDGGLAGFAGAAAAGEQRGVGGGGLVEVDEGEHFAAEGFVADPEDEVGAPLHGFPGVRQGEEVGAEAFGVHGGRLRGRGRGGKRCVTAVADNAICED